MVEVLFRGPRQPSGFELALSQAGLGFGQGFGEGIQQQQQVQARQDFAQGLVPQPGQQVGPGASPFAQTGAIQGSTPFSFGQPLGQQAEQQQQQAAADPRQQVLAAIQANPEILADENAFNQIIAQLQPPEAASADPFTLSPGQTRFDAQGNPIAQVEDQADEDPITRNLRLADEARAEGRDRAATLFERRAEKEAGKSIDQIRAEAQAQAEGRLSAEQQFAPPEGAGVPDFLDDTGRVKASASGEVRRQTSQLFGGRLNAATGVIEGLGREQARAAQEINTLAERFLQSGQVSGISEAVALATERVRLPERGLSLPELGDKIIELAESEDLNRGEAALGGAEQRLANQKLNVADATGVGSAIVSSINNTLGQIAPGVVDRDVVRGRQRLALLQGDFINAFNRNPRLPVWEQQRLAEIFSGPNALSSPEAVREALREMDKGLSREINLRLDILKTEGIPIDQKQEAISTIQNLAQFRRRVNEFDVRPSGQATAEREAAEQAARPGRVQRSEQQQQSGEVVQTGPGEVRATVPEAPQRAEVPQRITNETLPGIDPRQLTPQQQRDLEQRLEAEFLPQAQAGELSPDVLRELRRIFSQIPPASSE